MFKKSLLICLSLVLAFTGCGDKDTKEVETNSASEVAEENIEENIEETISDSITEVSENIIPTGGIFEFESTTINGDAISSDIYKDYDLTVVNVMATWCPPCVAELPDLSKVSEDMKSKGVNIIGFVTDCRDYESGEVANDAVDAALTLQSESNVSYPMIIPNDTFVNGMLFTEYVPTTYFLNKNGDHVGEPIVSAQDYDTWIKTIEERLAML